MHKFNIITLLCFCVMLVAIPTTYAAESTAAAPAFTVLRSPADKREYQYLTLDNGLRVLLVSDPAAEKAAASLNVHAGSGRDPADRAGLAHFLEHMLFLGTEKYPEPDQYQAFIASHGGTHNAYTALEDTNYFFDIDPAFFAEALTRFASFFTAPLFNEKYVERERHAVHSEFKAKIKDDGRVIADALREVLNPQNPAKQFGVGNLDTLGDREGKPARSDLLAFWKTWYSADRMTLAVISKHPLPELEKLVRTNFAAVPRRDAPVLPALQPEFTAGALPAMLNIKPVSNINLLVLHFPIPPTQEYWRSKPTVYINSILGHEGSGTLVSWLKRQGWIESLSAGMEYNGELANMLTIEIMLTDEGKKQTNMITGAVFQAINRLRDEGVEDWRFDELAKMGELSFRFTEREDAMGYASSLSSRLQLYPAAEVLHGPSAYLAFDKELVNQLLAHMTPDNVLIEIVSPDAVTDKKSHFYGTPYGLRKLARSDIEQWTELVPEDSVLLPQRNAYIPENVVLKKPPALTQTDAPHPVPLESAGQNINTWFMQDVKFGVPRGEIRLYIRYPDNLTTPEATVHTELLVRLLNDNLNETLYPALLAGINVNITRAAAGYVVSMSGYSDKQGLLLKQILDKLYKPVLDTTRFAVIKAEWQRELENFTTEPPYRQGAMALSTWAVAGTWPHSVMLDALRKATPKTLDAFCVAISDQYTVNMLVYGNYYEAEATQYNRMLTTQLHLDSAVHTAPVTSVVDVRKLGYRPLIDVQAKHNDALYLTFLPAPTTSMEDQATALLLGQLMGPDFFHQVRTEKQRGYIVSASTYPLKRLYGLLLGVQSPYVNSVQLNADVQDYLASFSKRLAAMTPQEFAQNRAALLLQLTEKPQSMADQAAEFWMDIPLGYLAFDRKQQQIQALNRLSLPALQTAYPQWLASWKKAGVVIYHDKDAAVALSLQQAGYTATPDPLKFRRESPTLPVDH